MSAARSREKGRASAAGSGLRPRVDAPRSVLLVDDDDDFVAAVLPAFEARGHRVVCARSGAAADVARGQMRFDVVVVDGLLPDTDGLTWIAALRREDPGARVVFVSGFSGFVESVQRVSALLDVALVVQKPVDAASFCEQVVSPSPAPGAVRGDPADARVRAAVRAEYARSLPSKLQEVSRLARRVRSLPEDAVALREVQARAHRIRGTAGCYGFHDVGDAAGRIEAAFAAIVAGDGAAVEATWPTVEHALGAAAAVADAAMREGRTRAALGVAPERILVVGADALLSASLEEVAQPHLLEIVRSTHADAERRAVASPPDLVVVALDPAAPAIGLGVAERLCSLSRRRVLPIAFTCGDARVRRTVAASHFGAALFLTEPVDSDGLGLALRQLSALRRAEPPHVLLVAAGRAPASASALLGPAYRVTAVDAIEALIASLDRAPPDLVLACADERLDARELCALVRGDPRWHAVPIVVLAPRHDSELERAAFRAGADDWLVEPVTPSALAARLDARLDRLRVLRERFDRDALTGLPLRRPMLEQLRRVLAESNRRDRPVAVGLIDVDLFKRVNDTHGHPAGDRVLAALGRLLANRFRADDLRARWGGEEFLLAFVGETAAAMCPVVERVLGDFAAIPFEGRRGATFHASFSAGLAELPGDGASVRELLAVADERLYEAKHAGRARVVAGPAAARRG